MSHEMNISFASKGEIVGVYIPPAPPRPMTVHVTAAEADPSERLGASARHDASASRIVSFLIAAPFGRYLRRSQHVIFLPERT